MVGFSCSASSPSDDDASSTAASSSSSPDDEERVCFGSAFRKGGIFLEGDVRTSRVCTV